MQNSIDINHNTDTITPTFDGKMWVKNTTKWVESSNKFYKNEKKLPSDTIGNDGDYYAKYLRLYNYIKYSENFNTANWYKSNTRFVKEPLIMFPYNQCSKMYASTVAAEHRAEYIFYNDLESTYTFSLYVRPAELTNIQISLMDNRELFGVTVSADLTTETTDVKKIDTNFGEIVSYSGGIVEISENVYRVYVTAKFKTQLVLKSIIKLLDSSNNPVFSTINDTYGLFVNAAQLTHSDTMGQYTFTNGMYSSVAVLEKLYKKIDGKWIETPNIVYYFDEELLNGVGAEGDVGLRDAVLTLLPTLRVGSSKTVKDSQKGNGTIFYDSKNDRLYVHTNRGNYYLVYKYQKNKTKEISMAISLSQKTYQTYNRCGRVSHFLGYNTGGGYNFWGEEFRRDY